MDFIRELVEIIGQVVWAIVDGVATALRQLSGNVAQMSEAQAQVCAGTLLVVLVGVWVIGRVNWFKLKMFQPQTVTLKTDKTPWQVVADDTKGCLLSLILLILLAVIVYSLIAGP